MGIIIYYTCTNSVLKKLPKIIRPQTINSYFEGLFIDVNVISSLDLFGLAEEDEVFKQEDVAEVFPPSTPDYELILAAELTLLF